MTATQEMTQLATVQEVNVGLSAHVRCGDITNTKPATTDCGAQAYVEVEFPDGGRMEFCGHCYTKRESTLVLQAKRIIDHRPFLLTQEGRFKGVNNR